MIHHRSSATQGPTIHPPCALCVVGQSSKMYWWRTCVGPAASCSCGFPEVAAVLSLNALACAERAPYIMAGSGTYSHSFDSWEHWLSN
jgi:hypothetical protein